MARRRRRLEDTGPATGSEQVAGWMTLAIGGLVTGLLYWYNYTPWALVPAEKFLRYYLVNTACLLGIPAVFVLLFLRRDLSDFGMTPGDTRGGTIAAVAMWALFLPVIWFFSRAPSFQGYYIQHLSGSGAVDFSRQFQPGGFLFHQLVMGFYFLGWEWFFRGFLLFGLKKVMSPIGAALLQAVIFTLLHVGKPTPELISSFPGALLLAVVALRYRSFLPCFLVHWAISLSFDAAVVYHYFR